jgi:Family of unknown function (DUF5906)
MLKSLSGDDMILVNKKYVPEYQVQNNLNIILLSNEEIPVTEYHVVKTFNKPINKTIVVYL